LIRFTENFQKPKSHKLPVRDIISISASSHISLPTLMLDKDGNVYADGL